MTHLIDCFIIYLINLIINLIDSFFYSFFISFFYYSLLIIVFFFFIIYNVNTLHHLIYFVSNIYIKHKEHLLLLPFLMCFLTLKVLH